MKWTTLSSVTKYKNRYMTVTEDLVKTDHGDQLTYGVVRKEPFSVVVPWDGTRMLLVGQYRYTIDFFSWEFPMGHAELDSPLVAARRELQEETGLLAKDIQEITRFYPAPGTMNQLGYLYVATSWEVVGTSREPSERSMETKWVTLPECNQMIASGVIKDGPTIASLKLFESYLTLS